MTPYQRLDKRIKSLESTQKRLFLVLVLMGLALLMVVPI